RLIKYRKVDNSFPRFIANEPADDYPPTTRLMSEREREAMAQRQTAKRMSIFDTPQIVQYRVRFQGHSPVNLSDEDDDELQHLPRFGSSSATNANNTAAALTASSSSSRPPPQAAAASSLTTGSAAIRPQMLYSDAVRLGQNGFSDSRINGHGEDSVITQEEQRSEREQYLSLIRTLCYDKSAVRPSTPPKSGPTWSAILSGNAKHPQSSHPQTSERSTYADLLARANEVINEAKKTVVPPGRELPPRKHFKTVDSAPSHASTISNSDTSTISDGQSVVITGIDDSSQDEDISDAVEPDDGVVSGRQPTGELDASLNNSLVTRFNNCLFFQDSYTTQFRAKTLRTRKEIEVQRELALEEAEKSRDARRAFEQGLRENIFKYRLLHKPIFVIGSMNASEESKESALLPLTEDHLDKYSDLLQGAPQQVLVSKFNMNIHRSDIRTLLGGKWLNDEVINFYMNMITDRSERRAGQLPSVYAMNTFFVPRLLQNGHAGVKRWTRKIDLFSKDIIPVPVHCNGVHWCMAIIHMRDRTIRYYDSMGKPNQPVLDALENYLQSESLDKRKQPFDTSSFRIESMPDVPQQTNGSDCGVFSCMFAEYISRDQPLTFSQEHMDYFRKKMVLEICDGELWL
ncbi:hypothetical protein KR067_010095, partial [Drosophila pandora]